MLINDWLVVAMFVTFLVMLFSGLPIAWVLAGVGILFCAVGYLADIYLGTTTGLDYQTLGLIVNRTYSLMDNGVLVALPMFIFMGLMLDQSGVAQRMMYAMQDLYGRTRGGLALTVVTIGIILAASTGIVGASVVLLSLLSLKPMLDQGYNRPLALGTIASSGTLGILIPPSIMLVIMADQLSLSVGDLFMAAVLPGLLLGVLYLVFLFILGKVRPDMTPLPKEVKPLTGRVIWQAMVSIVPTAILIFMVLGSIFMGITTATEASAVGVLGATILAILYRNFRWRALVDISKGTFNTTAYIFAIFLGATIFSLVLRELGGDDLIKRSLEALPFGPYGVVLAIVFIVFLLGFVLDWIEITLIVLPIMGPIVAGMDLGIPNFGQDASSATQIWFLIVVAVTLQTSFLTPPVGFSLFYIRGVCPPEIRTIEIYKGVVPFILIQLTALAIVMLFPQLATWLPAVAYSK